mgnify:CR=1 FL=1
MITIPERDYLYMLRCTKKCEALEAAGVDNWEGYEYAMEEFDDEDLDNEED